MTTKPCRQCKRDKPLVFDEDGLLRDGSGYLRTDGFLCSPRCWLDWHDRHACRDLHGPNGLLSHLRHARSMGEHVPATTTDSPLPSQAAGTVHADEETVGWLLDSYDQSGRDRAFRSEHEWRTEDDQERPVTVTRLSPAELAKRRKAKTGTSPFV